MNPEAVERLLQVALQRDKLSEFIAQFGDDTADVFSDALGRSPECVDSFADWLRGKVWRHALNGTTGRYVGNWPCEGRETFAHLADVALQELQARVEDERAAVARYRSGADEC